MALLQKIKEKSIDRITMPALTVAYGDGIGPEIMTVVLEIMFEAGTELTIDTIEIGQKTYEKGWKSGITDSAWDTIKKNKNILKAPITTPRGEGFKSLNVTLRKKLGLFANVRPCISYLDGQKTDIVIVRENEEDLYSGVEYRQTHNTFNCTKVITANTSERICRYAFEYARNNNRKKVTVMVKDNIMKMTDGIFHKMFKHVASEYPEIETENYIIDIGSARIAKNPDKFDVIVTLNLYGDIISDIAAELTGSIGLGGSVNVGQEYAMFEAVHGSAPDIAGQNIANPSGLLNAAIYMMAHLGQSGIARKIYAAWLKTLIMGIHTADIHKAEQSKVKVGTKEFAEHIIMNMERNPNISFACSPFVDQLKLSTTYKDDEPKTLIGVDLFATWESNKLEAMLELLKEVEVSNSIVLGDISVKGISIWPEKNTIVLPYSDTLCCRFLCPADSKLSHKDVTALMASVEEAGIEITRVEKLYKFGNQVGFSQV